MAGMMDHLTRAAPKVNEPRSHEDTKHNSTPRIARAIPPFSILNFRKTFDQASGKHAPKTASCLRGFVVLTSEKYFIASKKPLTGKLSSFTFSS